MLCTWVWEMYMGGWEWGAWVWVICGSPTRLLCDLAQFSGPVWALVFSPVKWGVRLVSDHHHTPTPHWTQHWSHQEPQHNSGTSHPQRGWHSYSLGGEGNHCLNGPSPWPRILPAGCCSAAHTPTERGLCSWFAEELLNPHMHFKVASNSTFALI